MRKCRRNTTVQQALKSKEGWRLQEFIDSLSREHFEILDSGGMGIECSQALVQKESARLLYSMISKKFLAENSLELDRVVLPIMAWSNQISIAYLPRYLQLFLIPGFKKNQLNINDLRRGHLKCLYLNPKAMMQVNTLEELERINFRPIMIENFVHNIMLPGIRIAYLMPLICNNGSFNSNASIIADMTLSFPYIYEREFITPPFIIAKFILLLCQGVGLIRPSIIEVIITYGMLITSILAICSKGLELYQDLKYSNDCLSFENDFIEKEKKIRLMGIDVMVPEALINNGYSLLL